LRTAFRMLHRTPGTSALIVATLALAIGAATIGFAFADPSAVSRLARRRQLKGRLVHGDGRARLRISWPDLRTRSPRLPCPQHDARAAVRHARWARSAHSQRPVTNAERDVCDGQPVCRHGQTPLAGRVFVEGEDLAGAAPVAVLSHHYWRDEMGSGRTRSAARCRSAARW
jgi:hypothetical protein